MNPILRNILAVLAGIVAGGALNMGIISISSAIIPPPPGSDLTTTEGLKAAMSLMGPEHFLMPFLAHALGTLLGAFITAKFVTTSKIIFALGIGAWNFIGGLMMVMMLPSPIWFTVLDLAGAYLPFAFIGAKLATLNK